MTNRPPPFIGEDDDEDEDDEEELSIVSRHHLLPANLAGHVQVINVDGHVGRIPLDVLPDDEFEKIWQQRMNVDTNESTAGRVEEVVAATRAVSPARTAAVSWARSIFGVAELLLPKRMRSEEIGDALEVVDRIVADPGRRSARFAVWVKIVSTCFWLALHATKEIFATFWGKKAE